MWRIHAHLNFLAIGQLVFLHRAGQPLQIIHQHAVHTAPTHALGGEGITTPGAERSEEGTTFDSGSLDVFGDGLRRAEMNSFRLGSCALELEAEYLRALSCC